MLNVRTQVKFVPKLPARKSLPPLSLLIYDRILESRFRGWIAKFPFRYGVVAGEELKNLRQFPRHVENLLRIAQDMRAREITIVAAGGGSVGDFSGLVASLFKRGVPLVHVPSTWLAAIDSAHGGKTALNAGGFKNQIGTFYPATTVYLCRELLLSQPSERAREAAGEVRKTVLLAGGTLWKKTSRLSNFSERQLYALLPELVRYKYRIVKRDPLERTGVRLWLNLGHTLGHVFEARDGLAHGNAVNMGLRFSIEYSRARKILPHAAYVKFEASEFARGLPTRDELKAILRPMPNLERYLLQDKKIAPGGRLKFVFLEAIGRPKVASVPVEALGFFCRSFARRRS